MKKTTKGTKGTKATARMVPENAAAETVNAEDPIVNAEPIDEDTGAELVNADEVETTDQVQDLPEQPVGDVPESVSEAIRQADSDSSTDSGIVNLPAADAAAAAVARARDPRLPARGTIITKTWRTHRVEAVEGDDGVFRATIDSAELGTGKSLTRIAELALATQGITSGVNGFRWFGLGLEAAAPRTRGPSILKLAGEVERLEALFAKAAARAAALETELEAARKTLETAKAAVSAPETVDETPEAEASAA